MEKAYLIAKYLLALLLIVFGANKFVGFITMPDYAPESPQLNYMIGLSGVHIFPVLGIIYIGSAILLLTNRMVGLATVILAAIAFNFLLFHIVLDPAGLLPAIVFTVLLGLVMAGNKSKYEGLLQ